MNISNLDKTFALFVFMPCPLAKAAGGARSGSTTKPPKLSYQTWLVDDTDRVLLMFLQVIW